MIKFVVIVVSVLLGVRVWNVMESVEETKRLAEKPVAKMSNGSEGVTVHWWHQVIDQYGVPFGSACVRFLYSVYMSLSLFNVTIFFLKYVPTGFYTFKFLKNIYITSRERINQKQIELEDLLLQIEIVNSKISVRDSEFTERTEQLRRDVERLRKLRHRVRSIIAADEALRQALHGATVWDAKQNDGQRTTPEQDGKFIMGLLKGLKFDAMDKPEQKSEKMESGEHAQTEYHTPETSVYTALSDMDGNQDCQVKIVKVTNVYKVAYLKHYIKQKRLRRAHKHALFKKKMETIKKLLEDWQKSLDMVMSNRLTFLSMDSQIDVASQEAMGDYSKATLRESSDSDCELRHSGTDNDESCDEYSLRWTQNPYRSYCYNYEEVPEPGLIREYSEDFEMKYPMSTHSCQGEPRQLCPLPEETVSQVAIEELRDEAPLDVAT